ncbi:MAG TPA: dUTP diphosphatase [Blastocatellia bacterium]|nr:dUTP diphosphatase [Blastocatellia bacterium]
MMLELKIKLLEEGLPVPRYQHAGDAGLDLPSRIDYRLEPGERARIPTGVAVAIPHGYAGFVMVRSGLAARHGISCVNAPGLIDAGYRGEIVVILLNTDRRAPFVIQRGDRIAQLVLQKVVEATTVLVDELDETTRGAGGFGSTGQS